MVRPAARRPSSARTLYSALEVLGAAPTPDPRLRPDGPRPTDTALLLGVLLAKAELDAAVRADPAQEPPRGLTDLLTGYRSTLTSPADETRLRLLSLRLVRSSVEATLDHNPSDLASAAGDAALAAAGLIDAERLQRTGADHAAVAASLTAATLSLHAAQQDLGR
jgi:pimeloyl-ACP methyl ester carboxylesterase